jgi:hypothetical protein
MLELAAPAKPVAFGQLAKFLFNSRLRIGHKTAQVAAANVALHDEATFAVLAPNLAGPLGRADRGEVGQEDVSRRRPLVVRDMGNARRCLF